MDSPEPRKYDAKVITVHITANSMQGKGLYFALEISEKSQMKRLKDRGNNLNMVLSARSCGYHITTIILDSAHYYEKLWFVSNAFCPF